ncbi:serine/threonine-protein kinase [Streptomyces sp. NPDC005970]|uniref:WD40 repeat domain-containing serine/threonine protein kinase n=1 Tax=Streptomyces sp. NPDC005970 TaxID=3156723 RepID=UPI0033EBFE11
MSAAQGVSMASGEWGHTVDSGTVLSGRYELHRILGRGGMGQVWLGRDLSVLRREVAVKLLPALADPGSVRRFQDEAAALAKLQHPGITVVHDAGSHDGHLFIVMELLHGCDLAQLMVQQPSGLPIDQVLDLARQTVDALGVAHSRGIVHRDLKPANLFLQRDGRLKICDFGIARSTDAVTSVTASGQMIGTPPYMSPEQWQSQPVDARSDLYSLGCVIFELLTGQPPFSPRQPLYTLMRQHVEQRPPSPRALRPDIPAVLDDLTVALLAKMPEGRPDADSLAFELARLAERGDRATTKTLQYPGAGASGAPTNSSYGISGMRTYALLGRLGTRAMGAVNSVAFSPDGQTLASAGEGGVRLWNAHTGEQLRRLIAHRDLDRLVFSPGGGTVATIGGGKVVTLWDAHTGEQRDQLAHARWLTGLAFSPDGQTLASSGTDGIHLWNIRTGEQRRELVESKMVWSLAFSPDGQTLVSAEGGNVRLRGAYTGEHRSELAGHRRWVCSVAFSPDGQILAGGSGNWVYLWDVRTSALRRQLTGHRGRMQTEHALAFSPDARMLASGGADHRVHLWDTHTDDKLATLTDHRAPIRSVAFSPDGSTLAGAGGNEVVLWTA